MTRNKIQKPLLQAPKAFTDLFLLNLLPDDLKALSLSYQRHITTSIWELAQMRRKGEVKLRLLNPTLEKDGWSIDHTILEALTDDMPFLVDSVIGELKRRDIAVHISIHPVFCTRRDARGQLKEFNLDKKAVEGYSNESMMHIQFDHTMDARVLDDLTKSLRVVFAEVRAAVEDWGKMRQRNDAVIAEMFQADGKVVSADEIEEGQNFLRWLDANNFTYLGYRKLDLVKDKKGQPSWAVANDSGLGILRDESVRVFGGLRDLSAQPPEVRKYLQQHHLLIVTKTNQPSHVHRTVPLDAILVQRFDSKGQVIGEHLFVGLFTSMSYAQSAREVPYIRHKIQSVIKRANFDPTGHDGKALVHILDAYPRDELFQIETNQLFHNSLAIEQLQERARVALFLRRDPFGRFVTCLIYVPREGYDSRLRAKLESKLAEAFQGHLTGYYVRISDSPLAMVFLTIDIKRDAPAVVEKKLEAEIRDLCRTWHDMLRDNLVAAHGEAKALMLFQSYANAFPASYREAVAPGATINDIANLERLENGEDYVVDLSMTGHSSSLHLKLFALNNPILLSDIMPLIENMGLKVEYMSGPYEITLAKSKRKVYLHEFVSHQAHVAAINFAFIKPRCEEAFAKVWHGEIENDAFNALTVRLGLPCREVTILRALARYLRQLRIPYSHEMIAQALLTHAGIAQNLVDLFLCRHDPELKGDRTKLCAALTNKIQEALLKVDAIEDDRIIRRYLNLVQSSLRTNYFQKTPDGQPKAYLSIKFDSRAIDYMPLPKPLVEIFVYSPRVEAVHLRGGKTARGGIRWSDRRDDFRNEILGLMKAQMVKNSVIVPVGSKGGFLVKQPPQEADKFQAEGIACYRIMMCGLLDITDNRVNGKIVPPKNVVRHDLDDPYLVVAADKGTAKFSDIANGISQEYGFWLDDAFASGGSVGYDHKNMGITARGAWESVKRHFREMGRDIQTTDFTCVGVGDMSGDVFGNGVLLSQHTQLIAAFDHRHIFCDPNPDVKTSFAERKRMFALPRSSWNDYDKKKISKGGGVFARSEKIIKISPEMKKAYGLTVDTLSPIDLIQAMLRCKVDLLYFGGIGTYVKASDESHEEVGDRNNDALRIDGQDIQAKVIGEGANLGMTQRGRIEYAMKGGRLNTDAIDNSAGVDTSDHEVNIKILVRPLVDKGTLSLPARNKLLASMTDDVAALVLKDNYHQTQALTVAEACAAELLPFHARSIRFLEKTGLLNRAVEYLPDEADIAERQRLGKGLTRPELAVMLSYSKIWLYEQILASNLPDEEFLHVDLMHYFPDIAVKKYPNEILHHQLHREIIATIVTNNLVNYLGSHFVISMNERTGKSAVDVTRAYLLVRSLFNLPSLWTEIERLDNKVPTTVQTALLLAVNNSVKSTVLWFLTQTNVQEKLTLAADRYSDGVDQLQKWFEKQPHAFKEPIHKGAAAFVQNGVPEKLAHKIAFLPMLAAAPDITLLAKNTATSIEKTADAYYKLGQRLSLDWLNERSQNMSIDTPWQREALVSLQDDLTNNLRRLTAKILPMKKKNSSNDNGLTEWVAMNSKLLERYDTLLDEMRAAPNSDIAMLTLVSKQLAGIG